MRARSLAGLRLRIAPSSRAVVAGLALTLLLLLPAPPAEADGRPVETPNGALTVALPEGWSAKPLGNGLALEPPPLRNGDRVPADEMIVLACESFPLRSLDDPSVEDLLDRLTAGQLASVERGRRARRERVRVGAGEALVATYRGTDDSGLPAALHVAILPADGRVAILTARLPLARAELRAADLGAILRTMRVCPAAEEKALAARLAGTWRSEACPEVTLVLHANGTFAETRAMRGATPGRPGPSIERAGVWELVGREVRLRFDEGERRSFRIDAEPGPGRFVSAGQLWTRAASR